MKILTFDIEDWFHILDNPSTKNIEQWEKFDSRIRIGLDNIFDILDNTENSATFFVVGWMAEKHPNIIREISEKGFEIGSHTHLHQLAFNQDRESFYSDVEKSIKTLEDCIGKKITCFRAPGFSITQENLWTFEILHELGISIDCSVFPAIRAHGGLSSYSPAVPSILKYNGIELKEFPINSYKILGQSLVFSGGGYFRLLPYNFIQSFTEKSDYIMSYFHPRDFDYQQPIIPGLSLNRKFKCYVGLKHCKLKLEKWLSDFEFIDLKRAKEKIDWDRSPTVNL